MKEFRKAVLLGFTALLMVACICLPQSAMAKVAIMQDEELGSVIGSRGGISPLAVNRLMVSQEFRTSNATGHKPVKFERPSSKPIIQVPAVSMAL
jgi:hypothetical protein